MTEWVELERGWRGLRLRSDQVDVVLLPDKGCDVYQWVDRASGTDVLFKTPWGLPDRTPPGWAADSQAAWLAAYPGGWQLLCPNGGTETDAPDGGRWGFHGEACLVSWQVDASSNDRAELSTRLFTAPLRLHRTLRLTGRTLTIEESVTNTSPDSLELMWSHHPAFGAPFLDDDCVIDTGARTIVADDEAPGTVLAPGSKHTWPHATDTTGAKVDLSKVPGPDGRLDHMAYLTDFDSGWFSITNPRLGIGVRLSWPLDVFPHAWFWQEVHSKPGFPWWREAYVAAIEPASTIPGQGLENARAKGGVPVRLAGGETRTALVEAELFSTEERQA